MSEMQELHQRAVHSFFDSERRRIEDFLEKSWEPLFLKNFVATSGVLDDLQNVSAIDDDRRNEIQAAIAEFLGDPEEEAETATKAVIDALTKSRQDELEVVRLALKKYVDDDKLGQASRHVVALLGTEAPALIMLDFVAVAHEIMNQRRKELLEPLRQAEAAAMAELSSAYTQMTSAQALITGRLEAASRVAEKQDDLLNSLMGREGFAKDARERMSHVSETVGNALVKAQKFVPEADAEEGSEDDNVLDVLRTELNTLSTKPGDSKAKEGVPDGN